MNRHFLWLLPVLALSTLPFVAERGLLVLTVEVLVLIALAQAWNLLAGYGGLLSLGHHALFGIGGYALYAISCELGLNPYLAIPLAGVATATLALMLAPILFRLRMSTFPWACGSQPKSCASSSCVPTGWVAHRACHLRPRVTSTATGWAAIPIGRHWPWPPD